MKNCALETARPRLLLQVAADSWISKKLTQHSYTLDDPNVQVGSEKKVTRRTALWSVRT
jgi:hypothetical protein